MLKNFLFVALCFAVANGAKSNLRFSNLTVTRLDIKKVQLNQYQGKCVLLVTVPSRATKGGGSNGS